MEIKRYHLAEDKNGGYIYIEDETGPVVKYSDVEKLIKDAHANVPTAPTDEEIEKEALLRYPDNVPVEVMPGMTTKSNYENVYKRGAFMDCAKWMRDKLTPSPPKSVENS